MGEDDGGQRDRAVSTVARHSSGMVWQPLRVRQDNSAAIRRGIALGARFEQLAKALQARFVCQCGKGGNGILDLHSSRIIETTIDVNPVNSHSTGPGMAQIDRVCAEPVKSFGFEERICGRNTSSGTGS
ncbi:MAG: hypothetical protein IPP91_13465 [Betaproteobacteria bacterium]|nr:hypothetical protein [Betaproteobacteria bacterium]